MHKITRVTVMDGYRLHVKFENGLEGTVALRERLFGPVFEPLKNPSFFAKVYVDKFGAICWPNGADLAPDALYRRLSLILTDSVGR